jgi:diguanylate cyclase (GGDEF)-like protein
MDVLGKINAVDYIETAKRLNQNDFAYYPDFRVIAKANPDLYNFLTNQLHLKSAIGINIAVDNVKSHLLIIQNPKPEAFTKEYYHVLSLYVEYIAVALYNEKLLTLSSKDSLTGVMNRHAFDSYMSGTKDEGYIIVSGDLNNLKLINDTKGHNEGDEYIREAANTLSEIFGGPNHVFRFGGDEFICVKQAANPKTLDDILSRLRRLLRRNHVSMAIGGVWDKNPNSHLTEVIDEADRRMYLNKEDMHKNNI